MGEVCRARETKLGRDVAIKVLPAAFSEHSERLRRFEQEAQTSGTLNHPNILYVRQPSPEAQVARFSMNLPPGTTTVANAAPVLALSPDGRRIVFGASDAAGKSPSSGCAPSILSGPSCCPARTGLLIPSGHRMAGTLAFSPTTS